MSRLRVLILAPGTNPESITGPLLSFLHAQALAQLHEITLVVHPANEEAVRRANAPFRGIEVIRQPWLDRFHAWSLRRIFKHNYRSQVLTAFGYPFAISFEWAVWRSLKHRIMAGEFDVVLRLLPIVTVLPSPIAFLLRKGPIPLVIGPLNGGLPWPPGFSQAENQKQWVSGLRGFYRLLPFARSTFRHATAILAGSSQTFAELAVHRDKLFFVPENGLSRSLCYRPESDPGRNAKLELIFVGGLVPYKACDLALRAAASVLRSGLARFTVIGDGPERDRLHQLVNSLEIENDVSFCGWVEHAEVLSRLHFADVFVYPSVREFGGAVVFEALATGAVPVVADFGGPGDIVQPNVGFKVPLTTEAEVVAGMEKVLTELAGNRELLNRLRQQGMAYAREHLTWEAKAEAVTSVLNWALRRGPKPALPPPKALYST